MTAYGRFARLRRSCETRESASQSASETAASVSETAGRRSTAKNEERNVADFNAVESSPKTNALRKKIAQPSGRRRKDARSENSSSGANAAAASRPSAALSLPATSAPNETIAKINAERIRARFVFARRKNPSEMQNASTR